MAEYAPFPASSHPGPGLSAVQPGQRKSSIETEPRTLYEQQLAEAKGAAVEIMQTKEPEEAEEIFTTPTEDAIFLQPAAAEPKDVEAEINLLVEGGQETVNASQGQAQAKPLLSGRSSAPF